MYAFSRGATRYHVQTGQGTLNAEASMNTYTANHGSGLRTVRLASSFLFACLAAFLLEHGAQHWVAGDVDGGDGGTLFDIGPVYQFLVTAGPRKPVARFTVIVDDDPGRDPYYAALSGNVLDYCVTRQALALLIEKIAAADPAVIVIDRTFLPNQCAPSDRGTARLLAAVARAGASIPVVVGRRMDRDARRLQPSLAFAGGKLLREGAIELDPDTRKMPINWAVHPAGAGTGGADWVWLATLAFQAASAYDEQLTERMSRPLLRGHGAYPDDATHPYISFLRQDQLSTLRPVDILCGRVAADGRQGRQPCQPRPEVARALRGKVVIISATGLEDMHPSVLGTVPGFVLHANYIEALLDQRYFYPAPWLDYTMGFLIFASLIFGLHFDRLGTSIAWWVGTVVVAGVLNYFIIMHLGYYVIPVAISALALIFNLAHLLFSRMYHLLRGNHD